MIFPTGCIDAARRLLAACERRGLRLVTAESCTGGLIAGCLTEPAGSSSVVEGGFIVYANEAKARHLGVRAATLAQDGAVSERCAREMAEGALAASGVGLAIAVTGIAGPGGATPGKPVGLVHMAVALRDHPTIHRRQVFPGDRQAVRLATVETALLLALVALDATPVVA